MVNAGVNWRLEDPACTVPNNEIEVKEPGSSGRKNVGHGLNGIRSQSQSRNQSETCRIEADAMLTARTPIPRTDGGLLVRVDVTAARLSSSQTYGHEWAILRREPSACNVG